MNVRTLSLFTRLFAFTLIVGFGAFAKAAIFIPKNLNKGDRQEALRILGFGTSGKILTDPYPLGGYQGFEVGISVENLSTEDLAGLGDDLETPQQDVSFPKFTLGKGLYNDFDVYFNFTPYNRKDELSQFGGLVRWGFYQATFLPLSASVITHLNMGNISNLVTTKSYGVDFVAGMNVNNVAAFAGIGTVEATGTFMGGAAGITDTGKLENEAVSGFHSLLGVSLRYSKAVFVFQIDRYTVPVLSAKLGVRF